MLPILNEIQSFQLISLINTMSKILISSSADPMAALALIRTSAAMKAPKENYNNKNLVERWRRRASSGPRRRRGYTTTRASLLAGPPGAVRAGALQDPQRRLALVGDVDLVQRRIGGGGVELDRSRNRERRFDRHLALLLVPLDQADSVLLGNDVQLPLPKRHIGNVVGGVPEQHLGVVRDRRLAVESVDSTSTTDLQYIDDGTSLAVDPGDTIPVVDDVDVAVRIDRHLVGLLRLVIDSMAGRQILRSAQSRPQRQIRSLSSLSAVVGDWVTNGFPPALDELALDDRAEHLGRSDAVVAVTDRNPGRPSRCRRPRSRRTPCRWPQRTRRLRGHRRRGTMTQPRSCCRR